MPFEHLSIPSRRIPEIVFDVRKIWWREKGKITFRLYLSVNWQNEWSHSTKVVIDNSVYSRGNYWFKVLFTHSFVNSDFDMPFLKAKTYQRT